MATVPGICSNFSNPSRFIVPEKSAEYLAAVEAALKALSTLTEYLTEKLPHVKRPNLNDLIGNLTTFKIQLQ